MTSSPITASSPPRASRTRTPANPAAPPMFRSPSAELRDLLEANLAALRALHDEHQRMLQASLRAIDGVCNDLRKELHTISNARAPWIRAMSETRALLFIALRELVVGAHEAEMAMTTPPPDLVSPESHPAR